MKKVLFTGATGLLGGYFFKQNPSGYQVFGTFNDNLSVRKKNLFKLDITNEEEVSALFKKINPSFVVHAASLGNVDYCQIHKKEANEVNVVGTKNVLYACKKLSAKIIFTSSNAVYDGKKAPYSESSLTNSLDEYGKTKIEGENLIRKSDVPYVILRLMTMYGWPQKGGRNNPVGWIIEELKKGRRINIVDDIFNNHLYAGQAADVLWTVIKKDKTNEIYNVAGTDCVSRFELAQKVATVFKLDPSFINPVNSNFFQNITKRPKNTCFNTDKLEKDLGIKVLTITQGLNKMRDEK